MRRRDGRKGGEAWRSRLRVEEAGGRTIERARTVLRLE